MKHLYKTIFCFFSLFISLNAQWVKQIVATSASTSSVTTDVNGNIFITGYFGGQGSSGIQFDENTTFWNTGKADAFIAKYNSAGNLQWAKKIGGLESDNGNDVTTDGNGNVYVTGSFNDTVEFDSTTSLTSYGADDVFIAKYNVDGNLQWANKIGGNTIDLGYAIASDANNNIYVTGVFSGTANFDISTTRTMYGGFDAFLAKYNSDGELQWANKIGGTSTDWAKGITINNENNILITGHFHGTANFDETTTLTIIGNRDAYVAMYNPDGLLQWVKQIGNGQGSNLSTDVNNNIVVTGSFTEDAKFNEISTLTSYGFGDAFIARYNSTGELLWANKIGSELNDQGLGISTDVVGSIFVSGSFSTTANFDETNTLITSGAENGYIAKYNSSGNLEWTTKIASTNYSIGNSCVTEQNNNIIVTGSFQGVANFDASTEIISNGGQSDGFLAKYSGTDGSLVITGVEESKNNFPNEFALAQNYPNPFNPTTKIRFSLPKTSDVKLEVYNIIGEQVTTLVNNIMDAGVHEINFDASSLSSGIYIYRIVAGNFVDVKKMILLQ